MISNADLKLSKYFEFVSLGHFNEAQVLVENVPNLELRNQMSCYLNFLQKEKFLITDLFEIQDDPNSDVNNFKLLNNGLNYYFIKGNEVVAVKTLKKVFINAKSNKDFFFAVESVKLILEIYQRFGSLIGDESYKYFLDEYEKLTYNDFEKKNYTVKKFELEFKYGKQFDSIWLENLLNLKVEHYPTLNAQKNMTISAYYRYIDVNLDKSRTSIDKAISLLEDSSVFQKERLLASKINLAIIHFELGQLDKALIILNEIPLQEDNYMLKLLNPFLLFWRHKVHDGKDNKLESLTSYNQYLELELFNDQSEKLQVVSEYETKYQTAEKEKQILIEQQRATTNRNWLIAAGLALLFGSGIAILLQQNTTKKRKLTEQEVLIEQQKVETLLKEQELVSLDAMIAGQEKERTKVANELHDDLGSLMATVKLHFDNVKVDEKDPAMKSAQDLLEKAYQKIRGMAHAKNSGVMANQGLLPAVQKMARTINETKALEVTVEDFGLADRMENSLELTIFRILQELVTNIIKHAQATKASIQFTQHEDNMNIIVEDNGKGFDMSVVKRTASGMGLGTIEKRIEHLEGSFTVDSVLGKGTSILIDIPV